MARPAFKPTAAMRRKVAICAGGGMSHEAIAAALGVARNTLEKHFNAELSLGAQERRAEVVQAMFLAARKGNVTAQRAYLATTVQGPTVLPAPEKPVVRKAAMGKKERQIEHAFTVQDGTDWDGVLPRTQTTPIQ